MNEKYMVWDWTGERIYEFSNFKDASKKLNDLKENYKDNNCELQLYKLIDEASENI